MKRNASELLMEPPEDKLSESLSIAEQAADQEWAERNRTIGEEISETLFNEMEEDLLLDRLREEDGWDREFHPWGLF